MIVKPSFSDEYDDFKIISLTDIRMFSPKNKNFIIFKIGFAKPDKISVNSRPDILDFKIINNNFFLDDFSKRIPARNNS